MAWIYLDLLYRPLRSHEAQSFVLTKFFLPFQEEGPRAPLTPPTALGAGLPRGHLLQRLRPQGKTQEFRSLPQGMSDYHQLNELLHLFRIVSCLSRDTRMYVNLLYLLLQSRKVSVLLYQKFSLSRVNHRSSTSSGAQDRAGSSGNFSLSQSSFKRRRPLSLEVSDHDSCNDDMRVPQFCFWTPSPRRIFCTSCSAYRDVPLSKRGGLFRPACPNSGPES